MWTAPTVADRWGSFPESPTALGPPGFVEPSGRFRGFPVLVGFRGSAVYSFHELLRSVRLKDDTGWRTSRGAHLVCAPAMPIAFVRKAGRAIMRRSP